MAARQCMQALADMILGDDLVPELDAMAAISGDWLSSPESPAPVNRKPLNLSNPRGALRPRGQFCIGANTVRTPGHIGLVPARAARGMTGRGGRRPSVDRTAHGGTPPENDHCGQCRKMQS